MKNFNNLAPTATIDEVRISLSKMFPGMVRKVAKLLKLEGKRLRKTANIQAILLHDSLEAIILAHNVVAYNRMSRRENLKLVGSKTKEWLVETLPEYIGWIRQLVQLVKGWDLGSIFAELDLVEKDEDTATA